MYFHRCLLVAICLMSSVAVAGEQTKQTIESRWRFSYELIPIATNEDIGLLGIHYDIFPSKSYPSWYLGIGGYSGASGEEGGFFTAGLTSGWLQNLSSNWKADLGFHLGGGGGSEATFPGGGLIVRTHAGLQYYDEYGFNFGIANMSFPNTTRPQGSDTHIYVGFTLPDTIWSNTGNVIADTFSGRGRGFSIAPAFLMYKPKQKPITKSGGYTASNKNDNIPLMGIQLSWHKDRLFFPFEMYGAAGGGVDGYATIFGGIGYQLPILNDSLFIEGKALVGVGGDGRLDTGGGALAQPMLGVRTKLTQHWSVAGFLGKTIGLDGQFETSTAEISLAWSAKQPKGGSGQVARFSDAHYFTSDWHGSLANKTYFPESTIRQTDGDRFDSSLQLFGVELEKPLNSYLSAVGNTYWAYEGNIGSYAEGALGLKLHTTLGSVTPFIQTQIAVAGGGDVEVDRGFLASTELGMGYEISEGVFVDLSAGYTQSSDAGFKAKVVVAKLRWAADTIFYR